VNGKREQQRLVDHLRELVHVNNQEENRITVTIAESKNVNAEIAQVDAEIVKVREDIMKNNRRDTELEAQWSSVDLAVERVISNSNKMSNM
jgi:predicted component of type VI protein secretion system